jgi:DNA-binding SARP family transcriptional activator
MAAEAQAGGLPGLIVFAAGMTVGGLTMVLACMLPRPGRDIRPARAAQSSAAEPVPAAKPVPAEPAARPVPAAEPSPVPRTVPMAATGPGPRLGPAAGPARPPRLRIGVLGSLTVNGQAGALVPAQSQLIVALALHQDGLSNQRLRGLLGADSGHPKPPDSLRQLIARTRRALGRAPDGGEWIEHLGHGRYALHADARVDWHEFGALAAVGTRHGLPGPLTEALSMIRGRPFTGCYYWWLETAAVESVNARIVAAAEKLAELSLASGNPAAAVRAARTGLAADSAAEQLWRIMMRAEHAAGNLAGVREAWGRCVDVAAEVAADGQPDRATSAVYDQLLAR